MNQQNTMAVTAAAILVQGIATKLYGEAGAGVTDLIALSNMVQGDIATPVKPSPAAQEPLEMRLCELRHVSLKPNRPYVFTIDANCANCLADAAYAIGSTDAPPAQAAQAVDLAPVRAALQAAEALCVCCASVDGYSRNELHAFGVNMRSGFRAALTIVEGQAVQP